MHFAIRGTIAATYKQMESVTIIAVTRTSLDTCHSMINDKQQQQQCTLNVSLCFVTSFYNVRLVSSPHRSSTRLLSHHWLIFGGKHKSSHFPPGPDHTEKNEPSMSEDKFWMSQDPNRNIPGLCGLIGQTRLGWVQLLLDYILIWSIKSKWNNWTLSLIIEVDLMPKRMFF